MIRGTKSKGKLTRCRTLGYCVVVAILAVTVGTILSAVPPVEASGPSGGGGGGGRRPSGGGGGGFGISIQIRPGMGMPSGAGESEPAGSSISVPTVEDEPAETPRTRRSEPADTTPPRKLVKPRVPYLAELAMDIDKTLMELSLKDPANAVKLYKSALSRAKNAGDAQGEIEALVNLGHIYYLTGQFRKAEENYEKALENIRKLRKTDQEALALRNLAATLTAFSEYDEAEKLALEALKIFTDAGNIKAAQITLNNVAVLEKNRGRYQKALEAYEEGLKRHQAPDPMRVLTLKNLANLYKARGQYKEAIETYEKSLQEAKKIGDPRAEGEVLILTGQAYAQWGRREKALEKCQAALEVLDKAGAPTDSAKKIIGDLYLDARKPVLAERYIKEADYDSSLGRLQLVKSDPEAAKKHYQQLLNAAQKEGNLDELFTAYTGLGKVFEALERYQEAEKNYSKGLDITEEIRSTLLLSERKNFFAQTVNGFPRSEPAKGLVRVMLKQNKAAQSIYPSEATKARDFADNLFQRTEGNYFDLPQETLAKEAAVNDKLAALKIGLGVIPKALDNERYTDLTGQIKRAEAEKKTFVQTVSKDHKSYAAVKYPKPVTMENCAIGSGEYVLLFDVLGEAVGVRLIKGKKVVKASLIEWTTDDLENQVREFRKPFEQAQPKLRDFSPELATTLYNKLLAEAVKQVPDGSPITIIPDGLLALLPFEALVTAGTANWQKGQWGDYPQGLTYLGDRHPVVYYQSITALTLARALKQTPKSGKRILVVADPVFELMDARLQDAKPEMKVAKKESDRQVRLMAAIEEESDGYFKLQRLRGTEKLAKNLENLYGGSCDVFTGLEATKSRLVDKIAPEMSRYDSIVFATHGFAGNNIPGIMEPVLALTMVPPGTDGFLTMSEVAGLKTDAAVVALTACQTGVGIKLAGEGVMSMGRAFQCAGARSVVMSLWSVSEDASVLLMDEFFKGLKAGKAKLESWTNAREQVRKAGFEHPFFWAAFLLVGEAQ